MKTITTITFLIAILTSTNDTFAQIIPPFEQFRITSDIPYKGILATGDANIFTNTEQTASFTRAVIVIEGIDLGDKMGVQQLYPLINQQGLADCIINNGYALIILNFAKSTTFIQANAMMFVKLMQTVNEKWKVGHSGNIVIGASMGGLVARYGLKYMEDNNMDHETSLFISLDAPQKGANVPLGDQYWINFFAPEKPNEGADIVRKQLNEPAPQQLLVYHQLSMHNLNEEAKNRKHLEPATNSLREELQNELNTMGYPKKCRNIAIANGSGTGKGQGFEPGAQLLKYNYFSSVPDIAGNTWAVPDKSSNETMIFQGDINKEYTERNELVWIRRSLPYDNAPGGWRPTNDSIAAQKVDYGDIIAVNPNHCFIPTISALDINTDDLFYNIAGDPDILSKTPFNAIYYPKSEPDINQEHVHISPEAAEWIKNELVPEVVTLDATTWNKGEKRAQKSIIMLPGFHVDESSGFHTIAPFNFVGCD